MAKLKILTEQEMLESKNRFKALLNFEPDKLLVEYSFVNQEDDLLLDEADDDEPNAIPDPNTVPGAAPAPAMGEEQPAAPAPAIGGEQPAAPGAEPEMGVEPPMEAIPPMEAQPEEGGEIEVDVTDLTKKQDDVEDKVSSMTSQTQQMMDMLSKLTDKVEGIINNTDSEMNKIKAEIIKRNPTPIEVLQKRITVSDPFTQTPEDYWNKKQAEGHYKLEDDQDKELELKGSDIGGSASEIYKSFGLTDDELNQSLATMFRM